MDDINIKREARIRRILENSDSRLRMITSRCNQDEAKNTMNEMNAKREARKRKILENSENRLHKIGARYDLDETKEDKSFVESDNSKLSLEECTIRNGICNLENYKNPQYYTGFNEDKHEKFHTRFNENRYYDGQDKKLLSNTSDGHIYASEEVSFDRKSISYTYLSHHINIIMLAVIVNILLVLKLDDWFGKTVLIPYLLLMMVGRWYNIEKLRDAKGSNFMNVVRTVIFLKIKSNSTDKLETLFILCKVIINDFCLYIFSFVLMRYVHTICYYCYHVLTDA
ncbi:uncharacterized protein LOC116845963 [Odontomachus brunneus]|uniref:uncharacterized protein LOC116845963 n=1 Tax=Odontomachus brunneus TaxID=486640 RepID=UPI0013F1D829|nr:uncharacterized protein LOC116845963 [Odontomachus brunneus]